MRTGTTFKFLTYLLVVFSTVEIFAAIANQEVAKTHVRWNIFSKKEDLIVEKRGQRVLLKTLNNELFENLKADLSSFKKSTSYIKSVKFIGPTEANNVSTVEVALAGDGVELFNFYRDREKKFVFDFWKEEESAETTIGAIDKKSKKGSKKVTKNAPKAKKVGKPVVIKKPKVLPPVLKKPVVKKARKRIVKNKGFRDYRYGSSFIWDYEGYGPSFKSSLDIATKTPEFYYPVKNREFEKDEQEAHLQLTINFYRRKKYGLMYDSINLFKKKYGEEKEADLLEYIKANAILRDNIDKGNREPLKMAINMLNTISKQTKNYEMKKAIIKYLLSYYLAEKESVEALKMSKVFYVVSKENYDYEESQYAAEGILFNLAQLNQIEQIKELLKEKTIIKLLPKQLMLAYKIFVHSKLGNMKEVIRVYENNKNSFARPIRGSILFNVAEAYFRKAKYTKAVKTFDEFLTHYSFHAKSAKARLRIALSYEILEKDVKKTLVLYKNAINRSQKLEDAFEARIRYVALRTVRKEKLNAEDKESRVFLEFDEKMTLNNDQKKLLWLVRLRTFLADGQYQKALTYLSAIPLTAMKPVERRVFESDGAEIIYGLILSYYKKAEYSKVVRAWNLYKKKYVSKVANDSYMNFIVGQSYLKLGLLDGFEKVYSTFEKLKKTPGQTFPIWVKRESRFKKSDVLTELSLVKSLKLKNLSLAKRALVTLMNKKPNYNRNRYYAGLIRFQEGNYMEAATSFESFLANQKVKTIFDPEELSFMLRAYTDSLYELNLLDKFRDVTGAILKDTKNYAPSNPFMANLRERLEYLSIEIVSGKGRAVDYLTVEPEIMKFKKAYPKSKYTGRVNYLYGISLIRNKKSQQGKEVLEALLNDANVSETIKELARSELSLLSIKERTI